MVQDGELKFANPRTLNLTGYKDEEILDKPIMELIHPEDRVRVMETQEKCLVGQSFSGTYAFRALKKNGTFFWVEANIILTIWEGKTATLHFIEGAARISSITNALRSFARPETGEKQFFDIRMVFDQAAIITRNKYKYDADFLIEDNVELPNVFGDRQKLEQVFVNLIVNASDAIKEKMDALKGPGNNFRGAITVNTVLCNLSGEKKIKIIFKDNGSGMEPVLTNKIFDPFFTTKPLEMGTGLGLSIAYGIIKDHGGDIAVESKKGEETVFTITLPLIHNE